MKKLFTGLTFMCLTTVGIFTLEAGEGSHENALPSEVSGYMHLKYNFPEKLVLPLEETDFDRFYLIHKANVPRSGKYIQEWVPEGQDLSNWKEMITIYFDRKIVSNVSVFEKIMQSTSRLTYSGLKYSFETVYKNQKEIIFVLEVPNGRKDFPPFTSIMRQIFTTKGTQFVGYETRNELLNAAEKEEWVEKLKRAFLSKDVENLSNNTSY